MGDSCLELLETLSHGRQTHLFEVGQEGWLAQKQMEGNGRKERANPENHSKVERTITGWVSFKSQRL